MPAGWKDNGMKTVSFRPDVDTRVCVCHGGWLLAACSLKACGLLFEHTHRHILWSTTHTHTRAVTATVKSSRCKQALEIFIICTLRCSAVIWQEFSQNRSLYHSLFMSCFSNMRTFSTWLTQHIFMCIMCERLVDAFTLPAVVLSAISRRCSLLAGRWCHDLFSMLA